MPRSICLDLTCAMKNLVGGAGKTTSHALNMDIRLHDYKFTIHFLLFHALLFYTPKVRLIVLPLYRRWPWDSP